MLYFPGNSETSEIAAASKYAEKWQAEGIHCLFASHPGYGRSDGCILSEEDVYVAGQVFVDYALKLPRPKNCPLIIMGWSIGSGVAMHLAARNAKFIDKVVLQSPYFSMESMVEERMKKTFTRAIRPMIYKLPTYENIICFLQAGLDKKVLIMHAVHDKVIPYSQSQKLIDYCQNSRFINPRQLNLLKFIKPDNYDPYWVLNP
ncbi:MAG: alpha/beta hydrolase [Endozoicomonadaceae bacterium]|nr:alpha/beta hydrolase [Endozoicomonadaceae bacterium]